MTKICPAMKVGCAAAPTNRSVTAKHASKMLYLLCSLSLVFTAIITSTFIRIVTGKVRMFRIIAVMAMAFFSTWYSCFQTISFRGHILIRDSALEAVTFMGSRLVVSLPDEKNYRPWKLIRAKTANRTQFFHELPATSSSNVYQVIFHAV